MFADLNRSTWHVRVFNDYITEDESLSTLSHCILEQGSQLEAAAGGLLSPHLLSYRQLHIYQHNWKIWVGWVKRLFLVRYASLSSNMEKSYLF